MAAPGLASALVIAASLPLTGLPRDSSLVWPGRGKGGIWNGERGVYGGRNDMASRETGDGSLACSSAAVLMDGAVLRLQRRGSR